MFYFHMAPCCIKGCENRGERRSKKNSGITYHLFPKDNNKRQRWIKAINRSNWKPSNASVICSEHFENDCFYTTQHGLKRLVDNAVPTIKIFNAIQTPSKEVPETAICALIPDMPVITDTDSQNTKDLSAQLKKLINIYEKQKKILRNLRQKAKRQELRLHSLGKNVIVSDKKKAKRKEKVVDVSTYTQMISCHVYDSQLIDPLS